MPNEMNGTNARLGKERLLTIPVQDITKDFIEDMFAAYYDKETNTAKEAPFNPNDRINLSSKEYKWVRDKGGSITTSLGRLLLNRYLLERTGIIDHVGYFNLPINAKGLSKLDTLISNLVIIDKITTDDSAAYVDARDRLGFWYASFGTTHVSANLLLPMKDVEKRKAELFKERESDLHSEHAVKQIMAANEIENELMGMVRKNLENDPGYDLFASGDGNLNNNYKTINVMRGAVYNNATKRYDVVERSLMNGIRKQDITAFSNSVLAGAYPSAVGTAEAGYMAKILMALMQSERIDPNPKSDCGTKKTIPFTITERNKQYVMYRYIDNGGSKVLTTFDNIDSFIGKTVRLYSPQCCKNDMVCEKCAGRLYYNLGVTNVGLLTSDITDKLLNLKLKSKHDLSQSAGIIPENFIFRTPSKNIKIDEYGNLITKASLKLFIPKIFDETFNAFVIEPTFVDTMGIFPVKFYDKNGKVIEENTMMIPGVLSFHIYGDIQETPDEYIISYDANSEVVGLQIQKTFVNAEFYINQIYLKSTKPLIPYDFMTELMFRCLEINDTDLTGPALTYELLARAVCREGNHTFAKHFGSGNVDPMSYTKLPYRSAVQKSGILQGILFEDISTALTVGLSQTLDGVNPTYTPLEKIIKA